MNRPHLADRAVVLLSAASAPVLALLVAHHVISADDAVQYGVLVGAVVATYGGGQQVGKAKVRNRRPGPGDES